MNLVPKLVLSISTVAIFAVITTYVYNGGTARNIIKEQISKSQLASTSQEMDKIDRLLYERMIDIQNMASRQQIYNYTQNPGSRTPESAAQLVRQFNDFKVISGVWADFNLMDNNGNLLVTTGDPVLINGLMTQQQYQDTYKKAAGGAVAYSDVFEEEDSSDPIQLFMVPVRSIQQTGQPTTGVLAGELAWPSITQMLTGSGSGLREDSTAYLINKEGLLIASSDTQETSFILKESYKDRQGYKAALKQDSLPIQEAIDKERAGQVLSTNQKELGFGDYKGNNWMLIFQTPVTKAFSPINGFVRSQIFITLFTTSLALTALVAYLYWFIVRPIRRLQSGMETVMTSNMKLNPNLQKLSKDEIGRLGTTFNKMTERLQDAYVSLRLRTEQAESQQKITQTLIEKLPVGVMLVRTEDGKPLMTNHIAEEITGHSAKEILATEHFSNVFDSIKEDGSLYPVEERPLSVAIKSGRSVLKEDMYIRRPNGTVIATRTIASPITRGNEKAELAVSVFEDITRDKNLERSREEFFSIASHELRTPLTAIRGNSDMIQQFYGDKLTDPNLQEMISDIHESANRLIEIVNDFLDTSRLEQKRLKFNYDIINLEELAHSVTKEYQVTSSRQKIALEVMKPDHPLPNIFADRNRTKQVMINLVGNALKFTKKGRVTIYFEVANGFIKTYVKDSGDGMTPEAQGLLFRKFEQTGTSVLTRDSVRGTGLGLYISRMIIEQMHGHIQLESSIMGAGTTFSFSLPIAKDTDRPDVSHPDIISMKKL